LHFVSAMMRSFIISLTIFSAISCTGLALKCLQCIEKNSDTCVGVSVDCPDSTECLVVSELYRSRGDLYHSIKKGCNPGVPCNSENYISNFNNKEIRVRVQCCRGDNCNTDNYYMPPEQEEHNGRLCTSCYGDGLKECVSDRTVKCLNEEDKCVDYIGKLTDPGNNTIERNFKGCISPIACVLKFDALFGVKEVQTDTFECSD
ncbi:phospholipase A2 inhibitor gamma subunit B-like, partial [Rhinoderma darwinii]|uniref:phospholipase A2 inhibitor gamma subunit B-like n=1 Tax=Rhinoderma darwinii TaxID=43563 RepID=UPI003F66E453